jgi:hypothetical protein
LFNKSNPESERTGDPVNDVAGNFLRRRLYLKGTFWLLIEITEVVCNSTSHQGRPDSQTKPPKVGSLGKQWQKNKNSVIKQLMSLIKDIMSTNWCLTKLTLTPGNFEKPGQIVSFGVPSILKICK